MFALKVSLTFTRTVCCSLNLAVACRSEITVTVENQSCHHAHPVLDRYTMIVQQQSMLFDRKVRGSNNLADEMMALSSLAYFDTTSYVLPLSLCSA